MAENFDDIIKALPKPHTMEEQYYYALALAAAGTEYKAPFDKPFWRTQQYLYAWWLITAKRLHELNVPSDNTVSTEKIVDGAVTAAKLANGSVTEGKLAAGSVGTDNLADHSVTLEKLAEAVVTRLLGSNVVTEDMLAPEVRNRLLGANRVTTEMIADKAVTKAKIADGVTLP